jgi:hypothetical protein
LEKRYDKSWCSKKPGKKKLFTKARKRENAEKNKCAYAENPSCQKRVRVGAASSREIK